MPVSEERGILPAWDAINGQKSVSPYVMGGDLVRFARQVKRYRVAWKYRGWYLLSDDGQYRRLENDMKLIVVDEKR